MSDSTQAKKPSLNNSDVYPDDVVLKTELADAFEPFELWRESLKSDDFGMDIEWRYYKDGGSWLCKATKRKKTVCWLSVWEGYFKIGFYFTDKNASDIEVLPISPVAKAEFANGKYYGKLKHLGFEVRDASDLSDLSTVMKYKISILR